MDREKLIKQLFVGKVSEIIGSQKTTQLLRESTQQIDKMIKTNNNRDSPICDCCKQPLTAGSYPKWFCLREECGSYLKPQ